MRFEADFASTMKISLYIEVNYVTPFNVSDMHCTQIRLSSQQYSIESCEECKKNRSHTKNWVKKIDSTLFIHCNAIIISLFMCLHCDFMAYKAIHLLFN